MKFRIELEPENPVHKDINSHAAEAVFATDDGLEAEELRSLAADIVRAVAAECNEAGAKDVSHVKLFLEHSSGFLHASVVGDAEVRVAGRDGGTALRFRMVLNAVIFALDQQAIKQAVDHALDAIQVQYGLVREIRRNNPVIKES